MESPTATAVGDFLFSTAGVVSLILQKEPLTIPLLYDIMQLVLVIANQQFTIYKTSSVSRH
jgi:hypothetical protein